MGEGNGADRKVPAVEWPTRVEGERTWQDERGAQTLAWKDFVG